MKKLLTEFIGAFFVSLSVTLCLLGTVGNMAGLAIGITLMGMVFAGGHISGGHYNPAVTLAVFIRGKCPPHEVPGYILAQLFGAALAALVGSSFIIGKLGVGMDLSGITAQAILCEILGSFAMCYVVLNVATTKDNVGNSFYGLAIGLTMTACAYAFGGISGIAFNPAIALGLGISNISGFANIWIYWVGEIIGAVIAAFTFLYINGKE